MPKKLRSYWNYGKNYCTIEVAGDAETEKLYAVLGAMKKEEFVDLEYLRANSIAELSQQIDKNQHAYLVINSANVLIRTSTKQGGFDKMVADAYPGLTMTDFYVQTLEGKDEDYVFVCRKDYVDAIISDFETHKIEILGFELGFSPIRRILNQLDESTIYTSRQELQIEDSKVGSFSARPPEARTFTIGDSEIESNHMLTASALVNYLDTSGLVSTNFSGEVTNLTKKFSEKNFFRKGLIAGTAVLLITLLINFLFFSSYFKKQQELLDGRQISVSNKENYEKRLETVSEKERLLDNILYRNESRSSQYINALSVLKPDFITFDQVTYQPLQRAIKPEKEIEYVENRLQLSGTSINRAGFTDWINTIEALDWSEEVTILQFGSVGNTHNFELLIEIKDETAK